jgi:hypothetical protein
MTRRDGWQLSLIFSFLFILDSPHPLLAPTLVSVVCLVMWPRLSSMRGPNPLYHIPFRSCLLYISTCHQNRTRECQEVSKQNTGLSCHRFYQHQFLLLIIRDNYCHQDIDYSCLLMAEDRDPKGSDTSLAFSSIGPSLCPRVEVSRIWEPGSEARAAEIGSTNSSHRSLVQDGPYPSFTTSFLNPCILPVGHTEP